jgi:hypothetical protein
VKVFVAAALGLACFPLAAACSSNEGGGIAAGPSNGNAGSNSAAGGNATSGANSSGGDGNTVVPGGGVGTGGSPSNGGAASGGAAGATPIGGAPGGSGGGGGGTPGAGAGGGNAGGEGADPCGNPPTHALKVDTSLGEHTHNGAGLDTRAKKMLGKLVIDYGVAGGGYIQFLAKRGYHSIGAPGFAECAAPDLDGDRTRVSKCRIGEIQATEKAVQTKLADLQKQYPEEDWGYFLDANGKLRWSDVAVTGFSHGATTAAITGRSYACVWRAVSRSGPRDNVCGKGPCTLPISTPSYDPACPEAKIASWLDEPSKTPMDRFYGMTGMTDGQCGDIMFNMFHTKYLGAPVVFNAAGADVSTSHQFFAQGEGHSGFFEVASAKLALEIAFGIPPENRL